MLATIGFTKAQVPPDIFLERMEHISIKKKRPPLASTAAAKDKAPSIEDPPVEVLLVEPT